LVFLSAEREQRFGLVTAGKTEAGDLGLARRDDRDTFLVLVKGIALVLQVKDGPAIGFSGRRVLVRRRGRVLYLSCAEILCAL
jgi:hypothetical protein